MSIDDVSRQSQPPGVDRVEQNADKVSVSADSGETRLQELRLQVESDSYSVPATELASKIIDAHTKP